MLAFYPIIIPLIKDLINNMRFCCIALTYTCTKTQTHEHMHTETQIDGPPGARCGVSHGSEPNQPPVSLWSGWGGHTLCTGPPSWLSAHPSPRTVSPRPSPFGATEKYAIKRNHSISAIIFTQHTSGQWKTFQWTSNNTLMNNRNKMILVLAPQNSHYEHYLI